jgi:AcrR family transcriptional regulator
MAGVRQEMAEATRARLVETARTLFAEQGYFATGTTEIVDAAEVGTRGALYHHFADKKALFEAVFEAVEQDLAARSARAITSTTALEHLLQGLEAFLDSSLDAEVRRIILVEGPAVLGWDRWREIESQYGLGVISSLMRAGAADGSITVTDPEAMAHLVLSLIGESALYIAHADEPQQARSEMGRSLATLLSGLASK